MLYQLFTIIMTGNNYHSLGFIPKWNLWDLHICFNRNKGNVRRFRFKGLSWFEISKQTSCPLLVIPQGPYDLVGQWGDILHNRWDAQEPGLADVLF